MRPQAGPERLQQLDGPWLPQNRVQVVALELLPQTFELLLGGLVFLLHVEKYAAFFYNVQSLGEAELDEPEHQGGAPQPDCQTVGFPFSTQRFRDVHNCD